MLTIIKSGFMRDSRERINEMIKALVNDNRKSFLIVPEQETVIAEKEMAALLPGYAPLCFEVTNFTRLANSTFRALGGISGEYCDSSKQALFMWRTLTELSPVLSMTAGKNEISEALVSSALAAIRETESLAISNRELLEASEREEIKQDLRLASKLSDLAKISALYKKLLSEKYSDSGEDTEVMIKKLRENPDFLFDTQIFICGFTSFTEPQYKLIGTLCQRSNVTVHLTIPKGRENDFEYNELRHSLERLKGQAKIARSDIKVISEDVRRTGAKLSISLIADNLWRKSVDIDNITLHNPDEVRIFEATTPYEECDFIASDIKRRVMGGESYSDFAVIARSAEKYSGIINSSLARHFIPCFSSYKRDISGFEIIKLIYTAYSIISSGFTRENVITYSKCALCGASRDEVDEFERYVSKWQINGTRFTDGMVWNMNPDGYTTSRPKSCDKILLRINATREKIIAPLLSFSNDAKAAATVEEQARALLEFLLSLSTEERLKERAEKLISLGESELAEENSGLWKMICDSLDTLVTVSGDFEASTDAFLSMLKILFSNSSIGKIPAFCDAVMIGSADMLRIREKKHIYLIGVNDGEFPSAPAEASYFTERDKETLSEIGMPITPDIDIRTARELYIFTRAFTYAKESVTLLYTVTDAKFKVTRPDAVIRRISALTSGAVKPVKISELPTEERLYSLESALSAKAEDERLAQSIESALEGIGAHELLRISEGSIKTDSLSLSKGVTSALYGNELSLTQSRIDSFVGCPLAYFSRYTLKLSEDTPAEFDARGIGTYVHAILENFFSELKEDGRRPGELTDEERKERTEHSAKKYLSLLGENAGDDALRTEIKLGRILRALSPVVDGLCEEFAESKFIPSFFELGIKKNDPESPSPTVFKSGDTDVFVYGIIDRVDTFRSGEDVYVRVVDYKTGKKSFSPENINDGKNLQMFLYLKSIIDTDSESFKKRVGVGEGGRLIPAGVIYVKTSVKDVTVPTPDEKTAMDAARAAQKREGMVLSDSNVLEAMGLKHTPVYSARSASGISESKKKLLFDEDSFNTLMDTVKESVVRAADGILAGNASATPSGGAKNGRNCEFCEFKPICRSVNNK